MDRIESFSIAGQVEQQYPAFEAIDKKIEGKQHPNPKQISVIYGRNGAGKSTIARKLSDYTPGDSCNTVHFINAVGGSVQTNVFVFDEDYIISNFREKSGNDGLDTIVMLGETAELQDEIDELRVNIDWSKKRQNQLEKIQFSLTETIKETEKTLRAELAEDGGWRDRERKITNKTSTITSSTISALKKQYTRISPADKDSLSHRLEDITASISKARDLSKITAKVGKVTSLPTIDQLTSFFAATPLSRTGNELSGRIGQVFEDPKYSHLVSSARTTIWGSEESDFCPYCYQNIDESYKKRVLEALTVVFNAEVENLISDGERLAVELSWVCPESIREFLSQETTSELDNQYRILSREWSYVLERIGEKVKSPALPVELSFDSLIRAKDKFNETVDKANSAVAEHNDTISSISDRLDEAKRINIKIAQHESSSTIERLIKSEKEFSDGRHSLEDLSVEHHDLAHKIDSLVSRQNNTMVACEVINSLLSNIFGDVKRLSVEDSGDIGYRVLSRESRVSPGDLSTGERNAIALAYFFTSCMEGSSVSDAYSEPILMVLDDPLSSFDSENKYGVFNAVRHVIAAIFSRNSSSQVLLLSHDVSLAYDFMSVFRAIPGVSSRLSELRDGELRYTDSAESLNVYRSRVKKFYEFGCGDPSVESRGVEVTGNEFRMVFEAFCEFEYGKDISEVLNDRRVRELLNQNSRANAEYFAGPVYKLFLHGESHTADAVRSGKFNLAPIFSDEDRRRVCRELIALMFILNRVHILSIVGGSAQADADITNRIYEWLRDIEMRVPLVS